MAPDPQDARRSIRRHRRRRFAAGLNSSVVLLLAGALAIMVNYLSARHFRLVDITRSTFFELSDQSVNLFSSLSNTVSVTVFFPPDHVLYEDIERLLGVYAYTSDRIEVEYVDPNLNLGRVRELKARYNLVDDKVVVFDCEGRVEIVPQRELVEAEYDTVQVPARPSKVYFLGELMFSSAIKSVVHGSRPVLYFLQGHGEGDVLSFDEYVGFSDIAQALRRDNVDVRPLVLGERRVVPPDASAVVVAGPAKRLAQPELDVLRTYLEKSGRMLVMLEPRRDAGLRPLLADWGVQIHEDLVLDSTRTHTGPELTFSQYPRHDITDPLQGISTSFYLPRSVEPVAESPDAAHDPVDKPRVVALAASSEAGWAESDFEQKPLRFDADSDRPGPIAVAVAVEKGPAPGTDVEIRPTRMVVVGDSDFISNRGLSGGNEDLFLGMVNWLVEREELMGIAPKPFETYRLMMNRLQIRYLFFVVVAGMPLAVAVLGLLVWAKRRS